MPCYELLEKCGIAKDDLLSHHWYEFYNNAYAELITSHAALFGGLIAVAIALFGIKYWLENQNIDEKIKNKINERTSAIEKEYSQKLNELTKTINALEKNSSSWATNGYTMYLKTMIFARPTNKTCAEILNTIKQMLSIQNNELKRIMFAEISVIFSTMKQVLKKQLLDKDQKDVAKEIADILKEMESSKSYETELVDFSDYISFFEDLCSTETPN